MTPELAAKAILSLFILTTAYVSIFIAIPYLWRLLRELREMDKKDREND